MLARHVTFCYICPWPARSTSGPSASEVKKNKKKRIKYKINPKMSSYSKRVHILKMSSYSKWISYNIPKMRWYSEILLKKKTIWKSGQTWYRRNSQSLGNVNKFDLTVLFASKRKQRKNPRKFFKENFSPTSEQHIVQTWAMTVQTISYRNQRICTWDKLCI